MRKLIIASLAAAGLAIGAPFAMADPPPHEGHGGPKCPNPSGNTPPACFLHNPPNCVNPTIAIPNEQDAIVCLFLG